MKTKISINSIFGYLLFEYEREDNTIVKTIEKAIKSSANLRYANLSYANLSSANLSYADLRSADLSYANLRSANLRSANLSYANLSYANLSSANLSYANLSYANLSSANLSYADLSSADLSYANLRSANLRSANLSYANLSYADLSYANLRSADLSYADLRSANLRYANLSYARNLPQDYINQASRDMLFIFYCLKPELPAFKKKLLAGKIDGTQYEGECACLIGTMGKLDGGIDKVCKTIPFYIKGTQNAGEAWFINIREGDTPENNIFAKQALVCIDMILKNKF